MSNIKNIIFDLGGVIFDLDYQKTEDAFVELGAQNFGAIYSQLKQNPIFDDFEKGLISAESFKDDLCEILDINAGFPQFCEAWNAMLLGWPKDRLDFIKNIKQKYKIYLLSNTNSIHYPKVFEMLKEERGINSIDFLFEKTYFSNYINLRKPDREIFELVLDENKLNPTETLFVDDSPQNVQGAIDVGLKGFHVSNDRTVKDIISIL